MELFSPEQKVGGSNPLGRTNSFVISVFLVWMAWFERRAFAHMAKHPQSRHHSIRKRFRLGNSTAGTQLVHKMSELALKKVGKRARVGGAE
jgi:hypothetical protein